MKLEPFVNKAYYEVNTVFSLVPRHADRKHNLVSQNTRRSVRTKGLRISVLRICYATGLCHLSWCYNWNVYLATLSGDLEDCSGGVGIYLVISCQP